MWVRIRAERVVDGIRIVGTDAAGRQHEVRMPYLPEYGLDSKQIDSVCTDLMNALMTLDTMGGA